MIPKTIHYCWFGKNPKPKSVLKCINSWKKYCPDYEIIEWNEENFDVNQNEYLKYCYENKKWAFLSDLARLLIIYECGGVYFDTDVEVIKNFDYLLEYDAFYGFETKEFVASGLGFGAIPKHCSVKVMIDSYMNLKSNQNGDYPLIVCPKINTEALLPLGLIRNGKTQEFHGIKVLSQEYMNPYDDPTGRLNKTKNTISIHWYSKSWMSKKTIIRSNLTRPIHRVFGKDSLQWLKRKKS